VVSAAWAGAWLALAVWLALAPRGRTAAALAAGRRTAPENVAVRRFGALRGRAGARANRGDPEHVRVAVAQVAALLRAGAPPGAAWSRALGVRVDETGVPCGAALAPVVGGPGPASALVAASRLARDVGAPLGGVLEAVSATLVAEAEARAERDAVLAGPRATARVLLWLPAVGALLGWALGADPLSTATDGGAGTAAVGLGLVLLALGRTWTARLVAAARAAGEER
jgi:tight adherence protein B